MNRNRSRLALACAALVAAASVTVVAAPAQAKHGVSGGAASTAVAELRMAAQPITSAEVCETDGDGNKFNCQTHPIGTTADSVKLVLDYALVRSETHVPRIDALAGLLPAASCPTSISTLQNRPGASVLATGASFQSGTGVSLIVSRAGSEAVPPIKNPPGQQQSTNGVGAVVCLL